jgi:hypothetical protein
VVVVEEGGSFATHHLHHETDLLVDQVVLGVGQDLGGVVRVVVLYQRSLDVAADDLGTVGVEIGVILEEALERSKYSVTLIDGVVLDELLVFFYYLAHERFGWLEAALTAVANVAKVFSENSLDSLSELIGYVIL